MTDHQPEEILDQVYFAWSHDSRGLDVRGYSFSSEPEAKKWLRRLEEHLRLQSVGEVEPPATALSYIECDGGLVAVLRRIAQGTLAPGRNDSHALIGPAGILDVPAALSLSNWKGWRDEPPATWTMPRVGSRSLPNTADAIVRLRRRARELERELGVVITRLLDRPTYPLSIVGCLDEDRLAMVWGLRQAANDYLIQQHGVWRRWSFSTYQSRHDSSIKRLPEIVFLPVRLDSTGPVNRTIVDLDRDLADGRISQEAGRLVARLVHGTALPVAEPARDPVLVPSGVDGPAHPSPRQPNPAPLEPAPMAGDGASGGHRVRDRGAVRSERNPVAGLLGVRTVREFLGELNRLAEHWRWNRQVLRAALDVRAMDAIAGFVEVEARQELLSRLLKTLYGPDFEDLRDAEARKHAARLVRDTQSEQLARMVGKAAATGGAQDIFAAAFDRWSAGGHPAGLIPTGRMAQIARWARRSRRLPVAAAAAVIALLAVGFLLGRLADLAAQPSPAGSGGATTTSPTQAPVAGPGNEPGSVSPALGTATIGPVGSSQRVYAFTKVGVDYYPVGICSTQDFSTWQCPMRQDETGAQPQVVAVVVPNRQEPELRAQAASRQPAKKGQDWGSEVPVG
ncbi:MAG TPA: hypothetical protein VGX25_17325 [Actinophytocola sp.]|uniref:hypothetical protein n=1 Tax=Actinophytocola sp. TaxID=1872138 RepID=UPI002DDC9093|nr:hypothetical protein [Actinophytocola sp.]HEV2781149.1 hypothetical protein [Actinophytocola sp.]